MSKQDFCPHCESPYSDERDENGLPYCTCDGAEMEKLEKENATLKARIIELEQVATSETDLKKAVEGFTDELRSIGLVEKYAKENNELRAKVAYLEEVIAIARLGVPIAWIPKLIEQRERELKEGKTQRPLDIDHDLQRDSS